MLKPEYHTCKAAVLSLLFYPGWFRLLFFAMLMMLIPFFISGEG